MHDLARVDEGRKCSTLLAIKTKASTVVGKGGERSACYVTPDLSYAR